MAHAPWEADHEFDAAAATAAIRDAFPGFEFESVRYFAEGWDFRMFEVDGEWLFRFAKRDECRERLVQERDLLAALDGALSVPIPRLEFRAADVVGYRKLHGTPLTDALCTTDFAASLGRFATELHEFPAATLEGVRLPGESETATPVEVHEARVKRMKLLDGEPDLRSRVLRALDGPLPAPFPGPPTLVHNDLYPEHLLLETNGAISAVIDWADAALADPAGDFAVAMFTGGEAMLRSALEAYDRERDEHFEMRARFYGRGMAIGHIQYGVEAGSPIHRQCGIDALGRLGY